MSAQASPPFCPDCLHPQDRHGTTVGCNVYVNDVTACGCLRYVQPSTGRYSLSPCDCPPDLQPHRAHRFFRDDRPGWIGWWGDTQA